MGLILSLTLSLGFGAGYLDFKEIYKNTDQYGVNNVCTGQQYHVLIINSFIDCKIPEISENNTVK